MFLVLRENMNTLIVGMVTQRNYHKDILRSRQILCEQTPVKKQTLFTSES